jgi:CheY-like chemotaxis protein
MSPASTQAAVEDCFRSAQRAANLTGQLLTFSRRQPIEPRDLDLNEVVRNLTSLLQRLIGEHIALDTQCALEGASVRADPGMMEQVIMNLALNSRDAMPEGGRLTISTSLASLDGAAAQASSRGRPGSFVRLSVADTGTGIAAEHLPHIFEPFFTTKEVGKGTGLGLATVFGIVEQHDGWVDVDSAPGRGTTMHVYLPRLMHVSETITIPSASGLPRRGVETILLAEDEAEVRVLMSKLLERHGYRVLTASNGVEAIALWQEYKGTFDLLVTDMVMPGGISGRELGDRLLAEKPTLKVLYCSGYSDEMLGADWSLRIQANFLEKPFDVHEFLDRVRACLDTPD